MRAGPCCVKRSVSVRIGEVRETPTGNRMIYQQGAYLPSPAIPQKHRFVYRDCGREFKLRHDRVKSPRSNGFP